MRNLKYTDERPEREDVPLHRSYGVRKRVNLYWEKVRNVLLRIAAVFILFFPCLAAAIGIWNFFLYFPELWIKLLIVFGIGFMAIWIGTKSFRKRRRFLRKMKRLCRKYDFRLEQKHSFFSTFRWSSGECDFVLHTPKVRNEMRYLTVRKYNAALFFESKDEIRLTSYTLKNRFTLIFDRKEKVCRYPLQTPNDLFDRTVRVVHGILVNPVCKEMFYKEKDGTMSATGNGATVFGYTVYNASGFLEALKRSNF